MYRAIEGRPLWGRSALTAQAGTAFELGGGTFLRAYEALDVPEPPPAQAGAAAPDNGNELSEVLVAVESNVALMLTVPRLVNRRPAHRGTTGSVRYLAVKLRLKTAQAHNGFVRLAAERHGCMAPLQGNRPLLRSLKGRG